MLTRTKLLVGIHHENNGINLLQSTFSSLYHVFSQLINRLMNTRSIQKYQLGIWLGQHTHNSVAGSLRLIRHNGDFLTDKAVYQSGLTHIRTTDYCHKAGFIILWQLLGLIFRNRVNVNFYTLALYNIRGLSQWQLHILVITVITADTQLPHYITLFFFHFQSLFLIHVVIPHKVKHTVNGKEGKLSFKAVSIFLGLLLSLFHGNNNISQNLSLQTALYLRLILLTVCKGKGQYISRTVQPTIFIVKLMDIFIIGEGNTYLPIFHSIKRPGNLGGIAHNFLNFRLQL